MKKICLIAFTLLLLTACNEENIEAVVDEEDVTPEVPKSMEITNEQELYDALHP